MIDTNTGTLLGILIGLALLAIAYFTFYLICFVVMIIMDAIENRGGGHKMRTRNRWRKKLGLPKIKKQNFNNN